MNARSVEVEGDLQVIEKKRVSVFGGNNFSGTQSGAAQKRALDGCTALDKLTVYEAKYVRNVDGQPLAWNEVVGVVPSFKGATWPFRAPPLPRAKGSRQLELNAEWAQKNLAGIEGKVCAYEGEPIRITAFRLKFKDNTCSELFGGWAGLGEGVKIDDAIKENDEVNGFFFFAIQTGEEGNSLAIADLLGDKKILSYLQSNNIFSFFAPPFPFVRMVSVFIEKCENCAEHQTHTHHDESEYARHASDAISVVQDQLFYHALRIYTVKKPRVGSFEVSIVGDDGTVKTVFSKMELHRFPRKYELSKCIEAMREGLAPYSPPPPRDDIDLLDAPRRGKIKTTPVPPKRRIEAGDEIKPFPQLTTSEGLEKLRKTVYTWYPLSKEDGEKQEPVHARLYEDSKLQIERKQQLHQTLIDRGIRYDP